MKIAALSEALGIFARALPEAPFDADVPLSFLTWLHDVSPGYWTPSELKRLADLGFVWDKEGGWKVTA